MMRRSRRILLSSLTAKHKSEYLNLTECANKYIDDSKFNFKIKDSDLENLKSIESGEPKDLHMTDVFFVHQNMLDSEAVDEFSSTIEVIPNQELSKEECQINSVFYMISSVKVKWISNQIAYMHIFTDISSVKKYEKERATNKCLHIMFSSVSHEFRTPLNAISNSVSLLGLNIIEII